MANGYNSSSIIGGPLDSVVIDQLKARADILKKKSSRTPSEIAFLNSKTGWVKLSSSVQNYVILSGRGETVKGYTNNLAKTNVLQSGVIESSPTSKQEAQDFPNRGKKKSGFSFLKQDDSNAAYTQYSNTGIRPMPGITGFNVVSKNQFGTLRQATVDFKCWSVEQLTDLEKLYMRPGFSVLLEWGNTIYVDNKGRIQTNVQTINGFFNNYLNQKEKLLKDISTLKSESNNNYDGIYGYVKNFQWSYNNEGGYDCRCDVITFGELIESLSIELTPSNTTGDKNELVKVNEQEEGVVEEQPEKFISPLHPFLYSLIAETPAAGREQIKLQVPNLLKKVEKDIENQNKLRGRTEEKNKKFQYYIQKINQASVSDTGEWVSGNFTYLKLRDLLILINNTLIPGETSEKRLFSFNTREEQSLFYTFTDHVPLDPSICLISTRGGNLIYDTQVSLVSQNDVTLSNSILNINVGVNFIINEIEGVLNSNKIEGRTVIKLVKNIIGKIQDTLGNVNQFDLHFDEDTFIYTVIDRKLVPTDVNLSTLNLTGLESAVSNLSFTSKITPNLSTLIAISAQAGGSQDVGVDAENMFRWNEGLRDGIKPAIKYDHKKDDEQHKKDFNDNYKQLHGLINGSWNGMKIKETSGFIFKTVKESIVRRYNKKEINGARAIHASVMRELAKRNTNDTKSGAAGIIPFELNITLDGIGGIKIGQAFRVNKGILPSSYDDVIAFLVNGVDHKIENNRWVTDLKAQTIVVKKRPSTKEPLPAFISESDPINLQNSEEVDNFTPDPNPDQRKSINELQVSQETINLIKRFEGFEEKAYIDPGSLGKPITIGYGTTRINGQPISLGQTITESEAERYLRIDVNRFAESVKRLVKVDLTENEFGSLVSFAYNAGPGNLKASTLLRRINEQRYIAGSNQFLRWTKASGKELKGLIKRRQAEKQLFLKGNPGDPA